MLISPSVIAGTVKVPASKSETHREYVISALTAGTSTIFNPLVSSDTDATLNGLELLGATVRKSEHRIDITGGTLHASPTVINACNSGTTLRFLLAVAALCRGTTRFTGDSSLMARPIDPLLTALKTLGARIQKSATMIAVTGPITPGRVFIRGDVSSQFISALLIIGCTLTLTSVPVSQPYISLTCSSLSRRGRRYTYTKKTKSYTGTGILLPQTIEISGDWTAGAYLLAAGSIAGTVTVTGLSYPTYQGDSAILSILTAFGISVSGSFHALNSRGYSSMTVSKTDINGGCTFDMKNTPDLVPIVAVLAAYANGVTVITGIEHLKYKESNRLESITQMLTCLGCTVSHTDDTLTIAGTGHLTGSLITSGGDHRMAMAGVIAALGAQNDTILETSQDDFDVSYPLFIDELKRMGAKIA